MAPLDVLQRHYRRFVARKKRAFEDEVEVEVEVELDLGNGGAPETGVEMQMKELYRVRSSDPLWPRVMRCSR